MKSENQVAAVVRARSPPQRSGQFAGGRTKRSCVTCGLIPGLLSDEWWRLLRILSPRGSMRAPEAGLSICGPGTK